MSYKCIELELMAKYGKGGSFMKVCNITAIKAAPMITEDKTTTPITPVEKENYRLTNKDRIEVTPQIKKEIQSTISNDERMFQLREKKYPLSSRFNFISGDDNEVSEMLKRFQDTSEQMMADFLDGKATVDDLMNHFCDIADEAIETYTKKGYLGNFDVEKSALLSNLYEKFRYAVNIKAVQVNHAEGKQYCEDETKRYTYYNAEYYYKAKEITDALEEEVKAIAKEWEIEEYTAPTNLKGYYGNFNSCMFAAGTSKMLDFYKEPPRDFKFFFQDITPSRFYVTELQIGDKVVYTSPKSCDGECAGIVKVWSEQWNGTAKIPFKGSLDDFYMVSDIFKNNNVPAYLQDCLENFQVFSNAGESLLYWKEKYWTK